MDAWLRQTGLMCCASTDIEWLKALDRDVAVFATEKERLDVWRALESEIPRVVVSQKDNAFTSLKSRSTVFYGALAACRVGKDDWRAVIEKEIRGVPPDAPPGKVIRNIVAAGHLDWLDCPEKMDYAASMCADILRWNKGEVLGSFGRDILNAKRTEARNARRRGGE